MLYFVNRQSYWGVEEKDSVIVEIAVGGSDYANPGMLVPKWRNLGEGQEFKDPREAVEAAIAICRAWRQAGEKKAKVAYGCTGGFTMPFDPATFLKAQDWADDRFEKLPKCDVCGDLMGEEDHYTHEFADKDENFCSEHCAEKAYWACRVIDDEEEVA
jgi:hypothetical protein